MNKATFEGILNKNILSFWGYNPGLRDEDFQKEIYLTNKKILINKTYDEKIKILNTYIGERLNRRHRPGRALEKAYYSYDIVCDFGIFRDNDILILLFVYNLQRRKTWGLNFNFISGSDFTRPKRNRHC